jgi:hypothetical protein
MSGITDIKNAFSKAAPGIDLRAVRMRYDPHTAEQVFEFDICRADGSKSTHEERVPAGVLTQGMIEMARRVAETLGATVTQDTQIAQLAMPIAQQSIDAISILNENAKKMLDEAVETHVAETIEHEGETYELAVDGKPKALFF